MTFPQRCRPGPVLGAATHPLVAQGTILPHHPHSRGPGHRDGIDHFLSRPESDSRVMGIISHSRRYPPLSPVTHPPRPPTLPPAPSTHTHTLTQSERKLPLLVFTSMNSVSVFTLSPSVELPRGQTLAAAASVSFQPVFVRHEFLIRWNGRKCR